MLYSLTTDFQQDDIGQRTFGMRVADVAIHLAKQNGEVVTRPLTAEQIERAMDVIAEERNIVMKSLWNRWDTAYKAGDLPEFARPLEEGAKGQDDLPAVA